MTEPTQKVQKPSNSKKLNLKLRFTVYFNRATVSLLWTATVSLLRTATVSLLLTATVSLLLTATVSLLLTATVSLLLTVLLATTLLLRLAVHYASTCIFGCRECFSTVDCWI